MQAADDPDEEGLRRAAAVVTSMVLSVMLYLCDRYSLLKVGRWYEALLE